MKKILKDQLKLILTQKKLKDLAKYLYDVPHADKLFKKTRRLLSDRRKMVEETNKLDWAMGELLHILLY